MFFPLITSDAGVRNEQTPTNSLTDVSSIDGNRLLYTYDDYENDDINEQQQQQ